MRTSLLWGIPVGLMILVPHLKSTAQAQPTGARSAALAGISAGLEEVWAAANNPAGLARYKSISVATSLEQRYLMKELGYYGAVLTIPAGSGCLGVFTRFSGYQSWIEQQLILGYGMPFGEHVLAGVNLFYDYRKAGDESRSLHQVCYGLGTLIILSPRLNLAFSTFNPFQLYYRSSEYATLPSVFSLCLSYRYSEALFIYTEIDKQPDLPVEFKLGSEYIIRQVFFIRCGINFFPFSWSFGSAMKHHRYLFEFSARYHQYLGFTPQITLQYDIR